VGKLDGTAFDGGSAEEQLIDVSGNCTADGATSYIDGFTEGLVGAKVGDVVDCAVTFPENYGNADLAGKEAVFTFTVNSIQREVAFEEVDDAFAQEQFNVDSLDAMYETLQTYLTQVSDYYKTQNTISAIQDYLVDNCQVEMPEDYLEARVADYKRAFIDANLDGDESQLEDYASTYYGYTAEELEDTWRSSMEEGIQLELIMDAIVEEMGLTVDETEYADYVSQMLSSGYYDDEDSMYEMYGCGDLEYGKTYFRNLYLYDMALDKIEETTKVSIEETEPESETEETTETENN
jgi:FKBP-type peptidyl-prolyl cis-trans isomerase (trigger factor)